MKIGKKLTSIRPLTWGVTAICLLLLAACSVSYKFNGASIDYSKVHTIQIETPSNLKTIAIEDETIYENKGVREINSRLQQSSLSGKKILLIENLQRMTNAAMNAFLKTCEEPLANRYLFATAEHES